MKTHVPVGNDRVSGGGAGDTILLETLGIDWVVVEEVSAQLVTFHNSISAAVGETRVVSGINLSWERTGSALHC